MDNNFAMHADSNPARLGLTGSNGDYHDLGYDAPGHPERFELLEQAQRFGERERCNPEPGHMFKPPVQRGRRGFGPRGYRRSEGAILEDVNERLMLHRGIDASSVTVTVSGSEVTLSGDVLTNDMKWLAEDLALDVSGVTEVHNELKRAR